MRPVARAARRALTLVPVAGLGVPDTTGGSLLAQSTGRAPLAAQGTRLRVVPSPSDGHLVSLVDRLSGRDLLANVPEASSLWSLQEREGDTTRTLTTRDAGRFRAAPASPRGDALQLTWDRFALARSPRLTVTASVRAVPGTSSSEWGAARAGCPSWTSSSPSRGAWSATPTPRAGGRSSPSSRSSTTATP